MTWAFITGGVAGLGVYVLVRMFIKPRANVLSTIARIDAGRGGYTSGATASAAGERVLGGVDRARESLGRGLPEALMTASTIGEHWAMARIRQALANARLIGITPWDAMARLGEDLGVEELRDLASALALAGDEGAKIRSSLLARAASLRR